MKSFIERILCSNISSYLYILIQLVGLREILEMPVKKENNI